MSVGEDTWQGTYRSESRSGDELKQTYLEALSNPDLLTEENLTLEDRDDRIDENFYWLAEQYADEADVDVDDISFNDLVDYIQSKEKGVALAPLSRMHSSADLTQKIGDLYQDVIGDDENLYNAEKVLEFHSDVTGKYDPENNDLYTEDTDVDLWRLQHDIAEGGRAFALGLRDTAETFDRYARDGLLPEMIGEIARNDEEGEYVENLIEHLEIFIENNVENYFEENFGDRIVDIEQTIEEHGDDIDTLIGRVNMLEGSVTVIDDITDDIANIYNILGNHSDQFDDVTDRLGDLEDRMDDYDDKLSQLETDLHNYVDNEISQLEADINAEINSIRNDIGDIDTRVSSNSSDISDLESRVNTNETNISDLDSRVSDNESDISDLDSRVSANEGDISKHESRINTLENDLSSLQSTVSALSGLEGRVSALEGRMNSAEGRIADNEDRLDDYEDRLDLAEGALVDVYNTLADHELRLRDLEDGSARDERVDDIQRHHRRTGKAKRRQAEEIDRQRRELEEEMEKGVIETIRDFF